MEDIRVVMIFIVMLVFMPVTMRMGSSLDRYSIRSTFSLSAQAAQAKAPRPVSQLPSDVDGDVWLPWEAINFGQFVREKAQRRVGGRDEPIMEFAEFFQILFGRSPPPVLHVAQGARRRQTLCSKCVWSIRAGTRVQMNGSDL